MNQYTINSVEELKTAAVGTIVMTGIGGPAVVSTHARTGEFVLRFPSTSPLWREWEVRHDAEFLFPMHIMGTVSQIRHALYMEIASAVGGHGTITGESMAEWCQDKAAELESR